MTLQLPLRLRVTAACLAGLLLTACPGTGASSVVPPTDLQLRGSQPQLGGHWLVKEGTLPRKIWHLVQSGTTLTGTISSFSGDLAGASPAPTQSLAGSLVGVGETWQVRLESPLGFMLLPDSFSFTFCPLEGGTGGCRTGTRQLSLGIDPSLVGPAGPTLIQAPTSAAPSTAPSGIPSAKAS